ncbi:hypothetical protein J6590_034758 [Homalodisca vitripennis]|nr:hypothetical protein J6590_034758 [Homalodisca vitripennis]
MSFYRIFIRVAWLKKRSGVRLQAPNHLTNHSYSNYACFLTGPTILLNSLLAQRIVCRPTDSLRRAEPETISINNEKCIHNTVMRNKPGARFQQIASGLPPPPGSYTVLFSGTNDLAAGDQITARLGSASVVVSMIPHQHDLQRIILCTTLLAIYEQLERQITAHLGSAGVVVSIIPHRHDLKKRIILCTNLLAIYEQLERQITAHLGSASVVRIILCTNLLAIYEQLERQITAHLGSASVVVSIISHRHDLPEDHPVHQPTGHLRTTGEANYCPPGLGKCYRRIILYTNLLAIYEQLERQITAHLGSASVIVSMIPHRHDLQRIILYTNLLAIYEQLERQITAHLGSASVVVSIISHRHDLPEDHPVHQPTGHLRTTGEANYCPPGLG